MTSPSFESKEWNIERGDNSCATISICRAVASQNAECVIVLIQGTLQTTSLCAFDSALREGSEWFRQNEHENALRFSSRLCFDLLPTRVIRKSFLPAEMHRRDGCGAERTCEDGCRDASSVGRAASSLALA